ncbi:MULTISPECIES: TonB-dependent receptor [Sphingobacterium]|uniref:TonB-dependent receptor n=1 Tax=Sphingobacterium TaxID=28453 RepID=UPI0013DB29B8|nr:MULTISPECIES: TonB-dependent receptor [unclassified Sphingobacterium]
MYKKILTKGKLSPGDYSNLNKWMMRIKITGLLILFAFLQAGYSAHGQKISIQAESISITSLFREVKKQSGYDFVYTNNLIKSAKPIHIDVRNIALKDVLDMCLADQPFDYVLQNRTVIVVPRKNTESAVSKTIKGKVVDQSGKAVSGASVIVKTTKNGTSTNENGEFELQEVNIGDILLITHMGYKGKEWTLKDLDDIPVITLMDVTTELDETVVIGYGTANKLTYTGSVSTVESKDIVKNGTPNITDALIGRHSGLNVVRPNGNTPGSSASFNVRGMNTINDGYHTNTPLIIIDGMQRNFSSGRTETDVFASIDPNDIESISVLKDAAAAAVYGARAANGVILITTKRGKEEKPTLSYNFLYGVDKPTRMPKPLNSWDWATLYNEALRNDARDENGNIPASFKPIYSDEDIQKFRDGSDPDIYANTNWLKEILKPTAQQQQHNLSLRGGSKNINYFVSLGHTDQGGYIDNYNFKRYNLRSNIDANVNNTLKVSVDMAGTYTQTDSPPGYSYTIFGDMLKASPVYPNRYQSDPSKYGVVSGANDRYNPYLSTQRGYDQSNKMSLFSTLSAVQQLSFVPGLSLKGLFSFNKTYGDQKTWSKNYRLFTDDGMYYKENTFGSAYLNEGNSRFQSVTSELHLNYARFFGAHDIKGLLLFTQSKDYTRSLNASRRNFLSTAVEELSAGEAEGQEINNGFEESARQGFVGRFNYSYNKKYLVEANFRYDASSNFPKDSRWGLFPSFAAGWNISEENFIKNNTAWSFVDLLKVRASWGQLGNDRIYASFAYLDQFNTSYSKIYLGDKAMSILTPSAMSNPDITWEKATTSNAGVEALLWNGLLGLEFDYFKKRTTDILAQPTLAFPATFGASLPMMNNSTVRNEGFEIVLSHRLKRGDFSYSIRPNIGFSKSKIEYMPENQANPNLVKSGRTQDYLAFGYQSIGLFQSYEEIANSPKQTFGRVQPGDIKYADISGPDGVPDNKIDAFDLSRIGNPSEPKITYGISGDIAYKAFDMSFLFQGAEKTSLNLSGDPGWAFASGLLTLGSAYEHHLDRWTPENTDGSYPRLFYSSNNNKRGSSYWYRDASYLRLKNLTVGYTLPKEITERIKMSYFRVFVSGTNLVTWDKLKTFDPELRGVFSSGGFYPLQKTFNIGVNINF